MHCDDEEEDEYDEGRASPEKKRLIRKDTPHYKKHSKITKLPNTEAVVALLQGQASCELPENEEGHGQGYIRCSQEAEDEDDGEEEEEEEDKDWEPGTRDERNSAQQNVKVRNV